MITQISILFFSETVELFETKIHMKTYERMGRKFYTNELGHMTKMATTPVHDKNLKNLLLQNQLTNDLENLACIIL